MKYIIILTLLLFATVTAANKHHDVTISIYNPYRIMLKIETKCDWNWKTKKYSFYKIYNIPKKGFKRIIVPNELKECEIWALDFKIF